jgi:phospholipid/cholesterol/gamma-HCH transport system permease protein
MNVIPKLTDATIKLSEKTIATTEVAGNFLTDLADAFLFMIQVAKQTFSRDFEFKEFLHQCFQIGYKSLPLISITGAIMGIVLTIQSRPVLVDFGAVTLLPSMVAISMIREMGPVIIALICAGKIGSGMGAELGSMKVTEQIDAMEVSSTNPMRFLVVTRVLAATLMIPLLVFCAGQQGARQQRGACVVGLLGRQGAGLVTRLEPVQQGGLAVADAAANADVGKAVAALAAPGGQGAARHAQQRGSGFGCQ